MSGLSFTTETADVVGGSNRETDWQAVDAAYRLAELLFWHGSQERAEEIAGHMLEVLGVLRDRLRSELS